MIALLERAEELGIPADLLIRARHNGNLPGGNKLWDRGS